MIRRLYWAAAAGLVAWFLVLPTLAAAVSP